MKLPYKIILTFLCFLTISCKETESAQNKLPTDQCQNRVFNAPKIQNPLKYSGPESFDLNVNEDQSIDIIFWGGLSYCEQGIEKLDYYGTQLTEFINSDQNHFSILKDDALFVVDLDIQNKKLCTSGGCEFSIQLIQDNLVRLTINFPEFVYTRDFQTHLEQNIKVFNPYQKAQK